MDFRQALSALRAAWWFPAIGLLLGATIAAAVSLMQTPLYQSSTQLFVSTSGATSASDVLQGSQFSQQRVVSYTRLVTGEELAGRVVDRLNLDTSADKLAQQITATSALDTVLIDVTVADPSPAQAQRIAEAVGAEFVALVTELETPAGGGEAPIKVTVTDQPEIPREASSPHTPRNVAFGLVIGLLLGVAVTLLRSVLDRTVKDVDDVAASAGAAVIGTVLRSEALDKNHTIDRINESRTVEDFRQLRTNLQFLNVDQPPKIIMVSSAMPSEGKTTLAVNLAIALADSGRRVTVIEADLRKPKVTRYLGLVGGVGLSNVLAGTADLEDVVQRYGDKDIRVVAAGPMPPNPGELLASSHMHSLLDKLRGDNDLVLVDAPPLLPVADASGLAATVDGVLLSVRYGSTRKDQLQQATVLLERVGADLLGVVLNVVPPRTDLASAYGYGQEYGAGRHYSSDKSR